MLPAVSDLLRLKIYLESMEAHLLIVWANGLAKPEAQAALDLIRLPVLRRQRLLWPGERFMANLSRFYDRDINTLQLKSRETGLGECLTFVLRDEAPRYEARLTSTGLRLVNAAMFDLREAMRAMLGGNMVHATVTAEEGRRDLYLLTGQRASAWLQQPAMAEEAPGSQADLVGAHGWKHLDDIFALFNEALPYLVLRNFEGLPDEIYVPGHNDVDMLVSNRDAAVRLLGGKAVFPQPWRVHYSIDLNGHDVRFDLRHIGDKYYDTRWELDLLGRRILAPGGFYRPEPIDYFYTLLYHAVVHKRAMKPDYAERLSKMADDLAGWKIPQELFFDRNRALEILSRHMNGRGYKPTVPSDHSVFCIFRPQPQQQPQQQ